MVKKKITRSAKAIWLVGGTDETFRGSKLPSRGEVLKVFFHFQKQLTLKDSVKIASAKTTELILPIWERARIPTKAQNHVLEHVGKLHSEWRILQKLASRKSVTNLSNQKAFKESLNDLFDIAHRDALTLIKIEEDRIFLKAQREKGRRGMMGPVDRTLAQKEKRAAKRKAAADARAVRERQKTTKSSEVMASNEESSSDNTIVEDAVSELEAGPSTPKRPRLRGTVPVVNPEVAAAFDRTNTSDRKAAHILSAMAGTRQLGDNVEKLIVSRAAIRRARIKHRKAFAQELQSTFGPIVPLTLHWDGKIMDNLTGPGRDRVDRLPVLVSGQDVIKLLAVPKLENATAILTTEAIVNIIDEWGLRGRVKALCFDTTAVNSGIIGGVCTRLERQFDRELLHLACRHHVAEIMLEKVFGLQDVSKSPNMEIFSHFRDFWPKINQAAFSTAMADEDTAELIKPWKDNVIEFAAAQLEIFQPRDDYRELLELTIIFLGGVPRRGIHFMYPGAIHRARWMARAIYCIKMWLFRSIYPLQQKSGTSRRPSSRDLIWNHLKRVCLFVTCLYVKYWFESPSSTAAPRNDLGLLQSLAQYSDRDVANAASAAFGRHLWYLSELLVGFSFFDDGLSAEEKKKMIVALKGKEGNEQSHKRIPMISQPSSKGLHDFVTKSTIRFFKILELSEDFMDKDPGEWDNEASYKRSREIVNSMKVTNDLAERGVALIQEFNASLTRNEEQKQFLLQVVEDHRNAFSSPTKAATLKRVKPQ
jgi:hypothetical protein